MNPFDLDELIQDFTEWIETSLIFRPIISLSKYLMSEKLLLDKERIAFGLNLLYNYQKLVFFWRIDAVSDLFCNFARYIKPKLTSVYGWSAVILLLFLLKYGLLPKSAQQKLAGVIAVVVMLKMVETTLMFQKVKPKPIIS